MRRGKKRGEEVVGSQVQRGGGFTSFFSLLEEANTEKETHHRRWVVYVNGNLLAKPQTNYKSGGNVRYGTERLFGKQQNGEELQ